MKKVANDLLEINIHELFQVAKFDVFSILQRNMRTLCLTIKIHNI